MEVVRFIKTMQNMAANSKKEGKTIGFAPTMGYLHEGHLSLIKKAREENDIVVISIFVNPTQFGPSEDFAAYPRDLGRDCSLCASAGADIVFAPDTKDMYPYDFATFVDVGGVTERLCGNSRPGHFKGVATIVTKLFNIIKPDRAYFGQKDVQQCAVVRKITDELNIDTEIVVCPIIREKDGLAMSSRNIYLNPLERKAATILYKSLEYANELIISGGKNAKTLIDVISKYINSEELAKIDYIEIVDFKNLKPLDEISADKPTLLALAVKIGKTRLIDNKVITIENVN